ncbi:MAG: hypothetical protein ACLPX5_14695 [Dissulfurispiraceae bacterium]
MKRIALDLNKCSIARSLAIAVQEMCSCNDLDDARGSGVGQRFVEHD